MSNSIEVYAATLLLLMFASALLAEAALKSIGKHVVGNHHRGGGFVAGRRFDRVLGITGYPVMRERVRQLHPLDRPILIDVPQRA